MNGPEQESRYRSLFEGSQASLSDMSARHAQALGRVGRLRNAIVTVLRRNFMELSAQAEANLGGRLSEVDDEIIVAYLEAFVADASRGDQRATLQAMAEAVMSLGVPLRGDEPLLWVEQIHAHRNELARKRATTGSGTTTASSGPAERAGTTPAAPRPSDTHWVDDQPVTRPATTAATAAPDAAAAAVDAEDYWGWEPSVTLSDLFKDDFDHAAAPDGAGSEPAGARDETPATSPGRAKKNSGNEKPAGRSARDGSAAPTNGRAPRDRSVNDKNTDDKNTDGKNASEQSATDRMTTNPSATDDNTAGRSSGGASARPSERGPKNQRTEKAGRKPDRDAGKTGGAAGQDAIGAGDVTDAEAGRDGELLGELFKEMNLDGIDDTQLWGDPLGDITVEEERWTPSPIAAAPAAPERPARPAAITTTDPDAPAAGGAAPPATTRKPLINPAPTKPDSATTPQDNTTTPPGTHAGNDAGTDDVTTPETIPSSANQVPGTGSATSIEAPFRPELFTAPAPGARRKRTRSVRVQAQAPEDGLPFVTNADAVLDDRMREALLAAASIPRPVFTRDLIAVAGDERIVDAWEAECRANVSTSPVRFVTPKSRHRQRGRLVAIDEGDPRPQDWWHQAVARYRAGRLYELGVLLHRVGDEIVSFELGEQAALFRLNTPRGLVGVVVALDLAVGDSSGTRGELTEIVGRLLTERLTLLAVLTASGENGSLENLVTTLEELALENGWRPTSPIVAARSWEYADDRGSSAVMVLSQ